MAPGTDEPRPLRVVVAIDDDLGHLRLLERVARTVPGLQLLPAVRGAAGIRLVRTAVPDMVLLDLLLPDLPGEEVLRHLRADPDTEGVPVVVLTVLSPDEAAARVEGLGVLAVLGKPLDVGALRQLLETGPPAG